MTIFFLQVTFKASQNHTTDYMHTLSQYLEDIQCVEMIILILFQFGGGKFLSSNMEQNPKTGPFQVIKMSPKYNISTYFKVLVINIWLKLYAEGCEKMKISKLRCHIMIFKKIMSKS